MRKGYIKIPINEVWEIVNKPHRLFNYLRDEVKKLPTGKYELLDFRLKDKKEIVKRFADIALTGKIIPSEIEEAKKKFN